MPLSESWFGSPPPLAADEQSLMQLPANRTQGKRAVGGSLHVTTKRLVFRPNAVDGRLGGKAWSCTHQDVAAVGVEPGRFRLLELFSGGLVDRVRVDLKDGTRELFVISAAKQRASELMMALHVPESRSELPVARVHR